MERSDSIARWIAIVIVATALLFAFFSLRNDVPTVDEYPHLGAGYSYWTTRDMRLNVEHPPLAKLVGALPLLPLDTKESLYTDGVWDNNTHGTQWLFGQNLIYRSPTSPDLIIVLAKTSMLIFFVVASWILFRWTKQRYGNKAALIAMVLFAFSPTLLAHSKIVATDVPALTGTLIALYAFAYYVKTQTPRSIVYAGLALGLALLTKFSTLLLLPVMILIVLLYATSFKPYWNTLFKLIKHTLSIFVIGFATVWIVYVLFTSGYTSQRQIADTQRILGPPDTAIEQTIAWSADKPLIRSFGHYALGAYQVMQRAQGVETIYYRGEIRDSGIATYFPFVYFIKEPLSWWALALLALVTAFVQRKKTPVRIAHWIRQHSDELVMVVFVVVYGVMSLRSNLNIGVRHMIPIYPYMIMLVAGQVRTLSSYVIGIALTHYVLVAVMIFPHYQSYFNAAIGGSSHGHRFVVDSNLDWGQDFKRFAQWLEQQDVPAIATIYFGWADNGYYTDKTRFYDRTVYADKATFLQRSTTNGWLAVSAHYKQSMLIPGTRDRMLSWLDHEEPVHVIGNSIFIYKLSS